MSGGPLGWISDATGVVVAQSREARSLLGVVVDRPCSSVLTDVPGASGLPCSAGCAAERIREGCARPGCLIELAGARHTLCCVPTADRVVSVLLPAPETPRSWERLTPREVQVLEQLAAGATSRAAAAELGVSAATVRAHVEHMRVKLDAPTRAALVARGFRLGLLR